MALTLIYRGNIFVIDGARPMLYIGRDDDNDIVIVDPSASRRHACVELRGGQYMLTDLSSNGTFLLNHERGDEIHLRGEGAALGVRGWIGLGRSTATRGGHTVRFAREAEGD